MALHFTFFTQSSIHAGLRPAWPEKEVKVDKDGLVKALRLAKISTIEAANAWLPQYLDKHNARFEHPAADATDAHRTVQGDAQDLRRVCAHHY